MKFLILVYLIFCALARGADSSGEPMYLPDVPLVDQKALPFWIADYKGKYLFVSFLYTHCPLAEACPLTIMLAKHLARRWATKAPEVPFKILMVTMDPERDSPEVLRQFADKRKIDYRYMTLATGQQKHIDILKKALKISGEKASDGNFYHDARSFLVDPKGRVVKVFSENKWNARDVLCELPGPVSGCGGSLQAYGGVWIRD